MPTVLKTYSPTGALPCGICSDGTNVWTVNYGDGTDSSFTKVTSVGTLTTYPLTGFAPAGTIEYSDGYLWITGAAGGHNKVAKISIDDPEHPEIFTLSDYTWVVKSHVFNGFLYLLAIKQSIEVGQPNYFVLKCDLSGNIVQAIALSQYAWPNDITDNGVEVLVLCASQTDGGINYNYVAIIDQSDNVSYITVTYSGFILNIAWYKNLIWLTTFAESGTEPLISLTSGGVRVDFNVGDGYLSGFSQDSANLYVVDATYEDRILKLAYSDGALISEIITTEANAIPSCPTFDSSGNLWIANYGLASVTEAIPSTIPTVITTAISSITQTSAISGGNITGDGGDTVIARGVCWNTTGTPTISDSFTSDGTGTGVFISSLTSLDQMTPYFVRAYATNSVGTAYGSEVIFTTAAYVRTNKIIRRVLQNLKDPGEHTYKIEDLIDRLNLIQDELCRDYYAFKGTKTLALIAGTSVYTVDPTVYKIKQIYTPSTWHSGIDIIHESNKWNQILQHPPYNKIYAYLWNGTLTLSKAPVVSVSTTYDAYLLPSVEIPDIFTDPEIPAQWDVPLEYGVTAVYAPDYTELYKEKAQSEMEKEIKESIQGVQEIDYSMKDAFV
jgi:hypothetical protein